jgi:hypothetical protein
VGVERHGDLGRQVVDVAGPHQVAIAPVEDFVGDADKTAIGFPESKSSWLLKDLTYTIKDV